MSYTVLSPLRFFLSGLGICRRSASGRPALLALTLCFLSGLFSLSALAAPLPNTPAVPKAARLTPSGGLLEVEQQAPVVSTDGASQVRVELPAGAENFQVSIPGHTIVRWAFLPQTLDQGGNLAKLREERQHALMTLAG